MDWNCVTEVFEGKNISNILFIYVTCSNVGFCLIFLFSYFSSSLLSSC